jgi:uncharacterized protein (TIGR02588 family)
MRNWTPASANKRHTSGSEIPAAEWAAAIIGLVVVLAVLACLTYRAIWTVDSPPQITITVLAVEPQGAGYLVRTRVANIGATSAAQVVIEGGLKPEVGQEERSQITLDYVAAGSKRTAGFLFSTDPRQGQLRIRALGYQDP